MSRLLVIEDDSGNRMVLRSRLVDQGYEVNDVDTGAKGLAEARAGGHDLVLVAHGLSSGIDCFEVCRRLKVAPETNALPIVVFTSRSSAPEDVDRAYEAGCEAFVTKAEQATMDHVVRILLRMKGSADRLADENRNLAQQNRRLAEERKRQDTDLPRDETQLQALREVAGGRPDGVLVVDSEGCVRYADRGACELLGSRIEGQHLGSLAPASGLEAFARDARTDARTGFRFDLAGRRNQPSRSLVATVVPLIGHADAEPSGLKVLVLNDAAKRRVAAELCGLDDPSVGRLETAVLLEAAREAFSPAGIVGESPGMLDLRADLVRALGTTEAVLIVGEPGAGRARVARTLHYSGSATGPLVHVACGALAAERAEAELFGWVRGAVPGTAEDRPGLVQRAHDGTLLLEDVERLDPGLRTKLSEVLREGVVKRVGGTKPERIDTRWVATTAATGRERAELLDELAAVELRVPPLRDREGDIELLARHFVARLGATRNLAGLTEGALWCLEQHAWPGNVDELRDCLERACARAAGPDVDTDDLPAWLLEKVGRPEHDLIPRGEAGAAVPPQLARGPGGVRRELRPWDITEEDPVSLELYEKKALLRAIDAVGGDKLAAARLLKVGKSTLYRKLKRFGIH